MVPDGSVCEHAMPPERPPPDEISSVAGLLFAIDNLRIDTGDVDAGLAKPESLDLDQTCSCLEPPSCIPRPNTGIPSCDGPGGRDNVAGSLLGGLSTLVPEIAPRALESRIHEGAFSILIAIEEWNGFEVDAKVTVNVRTSNGLDTEWQTDSGAPSPPNFDGNDVWSVDPGSIVGGDSLVGKDCNVASCPGIGNDVDAYVRDGVLVARFDNLPLSIGIAKGRILLPLAGAVLTARLTKGENDTYRIAGEIAGRLGTDRLLSLASVFHDPSTTQSLCVNPTSYAAFKKAVCDSADLAAVPVRDRTGTPCEALSESVRFTGVPAKVGTVRNAEKTSSDCPSFTDTCR